MTNCIVSKCPRSHTENVDLAIRSAEADKSDHISTLETQEEELDKKFLSLDKDEEDIGGEEI